MIKLASTTLTILVVVWIRIGLMPVHTNEVAVAIAAGCSFAWVAVFGSFVAWKMLLVMVRQLGATMRGK
jgi:hypothetical protein